MELFFGKNVIVTGGAGFIGSNLAIALVQLGANVYVIDSFEDDMGGNHFNLDPINDKLAGLLKIDIGDSNSISKSNLFEKPIHYLFNLAGNVSHIDSMQRPNVDRYANFQGHQNFLSNNYKYLKKTKIIYTSTRQVYGKAKYLPIDEKHTIQPIDINGKNKLDGELLHTEMSDKYDLDVVILRLTNTFGPRQLIKHNRQGVLGAFMGKAVTGDIIELYDGGHQLRDITFVDDVVNALLLAAAAPKCSQRIYNLSGQKTTLLAYVELLAKELPNLRYVNIEFPEERKRIDIGDTYLSSNLFSARVHWQPTTSIELGIKKTLDYYLRNKAKYL